MEVLPFNLDSDDRPASAIPDDERVLIVVELSNGNRISRADTMAECRRMIVAYRESATSANMYALWGDDSNVINLEQVIAIYPQRITTPEQIAAKLKEKIESALGHDEPIDLRNIHRCCSRMADENPSGPDDVGYGYAELSGTDVILDTDECNFWQPSGGWAMDHWRPCAMVKHDSKPYAVVQRRTTELNPDHEETLVVRRKVETV